MPAFAAKWRLAEGKAWRQCSERFDEDDVLFVDDPVKFHRMVEEFVQSLPKQVSSRAVSGADVISQLCLERRNWSRADYRCEYCHLPLAGYPLPLDIDRLRPQLCD
jgi:hypothetical protein